MFAKGLTCGRLEGFPLADESSSVGPRSALRVASPRFFQRLLFLRGRPSKEQGYFPAGCFLSMRDRVIRPSSAADVRHSCVRALRAPAPAFVSLIFLSGNFGTSVSGPLGHSRGTTRCDGADFDGRKLFLAFGEKVCSGECLGDCVLQVEGYWSGGVEFC